MIHAQNVDDYLLRSVLGRMYLRRVKESQPWCPPSSPLALTVMKNLVKFGVCHADNTYDDGVPRYWLTLAGEEWFK
jgi:hypothetical protein